MLSPLLLTGPPSPADSGIAAMNDTLCIVLTGGFFVVACLYAPLCENL